MRTKMMLLLVSCVIILSSAIFEIKANVDLPPNFCWGSSSCPVGKTRFYQCYSYMCYGDHQHFGFTCPNCDLYSL